MTVASRRLSLVGDSRWSVSVASRYSLVKFDVNCRSKEGSGWSWGSWMGGDSDTAKDSKGEEGSWGGWTSSNTEEPSKETSGIVTVIYHL